MRNRILLVAVAVASFSGAADAHFVLVAPAASLVQNRLGDPQKIAPCGGVSANPARGTPANPGTPSGAVTQLTGGSMLHLLMLVPAVVGAMILWRDSPMLRLPIVYAVLVLVLFAAFPGQQGPRYRHQVVFVLVWAQFTFIWQLLRAAATDFAVVRPPMRLST